MSAVQCLQVDAANNDALDVSTADMPVGAVMLPGVYGLSDAVDPCGNPVGTPFQALPLQVGSLPGLQVSGSTPLEVQVPLHVPVPTLIAIPTDVPGTSEGASGADADADADEEGGAGVAPTTPLLGGSSGTNATNPSPLRLRGSSISGNGVKTLDVSGLPRAMPPVVTGLTAQPDTVVTLTPEDEAAAAAGFASAPGEAPNTARRNAAKASLKKKLTLAGLTFACLAIYGNGVTINSIAGSDLNSKKWALTLFMNQTGRFFGMLLVCFVMWSRGNYPPSIPLNKYIVWPSAIHMLAALAWSCLMILLGSGANISVYIPIVGLYTVIPTANGILRLGEPRNLAKLLGIAGSFVAVLFLGLGDAESSDDDVAADPAAGGSAPESSSSDEDPSGLSTPVVLLLVGLTIFGWGAADTISSTVARKLDMFSIAAASLPGLGLGAAFFGLLFLSTSVTEEPAVLGTTEFLVFLGNGCSVFGWWVFALAGRLGDVSAFAPIIGLYIFIPALFAILFRDEVMTNMKLAGLIVACVSVLLIGKPPLATGRMRIVRKAMPRMAIVAWNILQRRRARMAAALRTKSALWKLKGSSLKASSVAQLGRRKGGDRSKSGRHSLYTVSQGAHASAGNMGPLSDVEIGAGNMRLPVGVPDPAAGVALPVQLQVDAMTPSNFPVDAIDVTGPTGRHSVIFRGGTSVLTMLQAVPGETVEPFYPPVGGSESDPARVAPSPITVSYAWGTNLSEISSGSDYRADTSSGSRASTSSETKSTGSESCSSSSETTPLAEVGPSAQGPQGSPSNDQIHAAHLKNA